MQVGKDERKPSCEDAEYEISGAPYAPSLVWSKSDLGDRAALERLCMALRALEATPISALECAARSVAESDG
jgi:hypothetical protein